MTLDAAAPGVALVCDSQGIVLKVAHDQLDLNHSLILGQSLPVIVDRASFQKALSFLVELRVKGTAFDWELNVLVAGKVTPLHFAGVELDDHLLIMAAKTNNGMQQLYEEMIRINNDQIKALRRSFKTQAELDTSFYDQISRLNNELVNLQRELSKKNAMLEQLNREKNQVLGIAAHDLRGPLSIILTYSDFLLAEAAPALDEEHVEFISRIRSSSEFLLGLVEDLLDISAIEAGKLRLELQSVDLVSVVERNVALNKVLASKKQIELRFSREGQPLPVMADASKLEQVLSNLITNAVKFSPPQRLIDLKVVEDEGRAVISVQDQGPGIPANELDRLFKPFSRTSVRSPTGEKSTGLGLAIARKIVEGHQGSIWVNSEVGVGSTFYFSLPLAAQG